MIELKNLDFEVYDDKTKANKKILSNLNIVFPKNKVTVITGHNGSGKSTLIKLVMGLNTPTSGQIFFDGKDITNLSIQERAKLGLTIAFQQPVKFKGLKVSDLLNLASGEQNNISKACEYLAKVGLCAKDYIDRDLDETLSGGELKRIELAIALAKCGSVMLFDEPEAGIDLWSFDDLIGLFKELKDKTVIIVSHQKKILDMADYILLLNNKENYKMGKKKEISPLLDAPKCRKLGGMING